MNEVSTVPVRVRIDIPVGIVEIPAESLDGDNIYTDALAATVRMLKGMSDADIAKLVREQANVCEVTYEDNTETLYCVDYFD